MASRGDNDSDGAQSICLLGGTDCDDNDPNRFPGNVEIADPDNKDEDCDPTTFGKRDEDGDGYYDATACNFSGGYKYCGTDCNDHDARVNPGRLEVCDGIDNNCNADVDEGVMMTVYRDNDRDGFGDANGQTQLQCHPSPGWVANNYDCDDNDPRKNPITGTCR